MVVLTDYHPCSSARDKVLGWPSTICIGEKTSTGQVRTYFGLNDGKMELLRIGLDGDIFHSAVVPEFALGVRSLSTRSNFCPSTDLLTEDFAILETSYAVVRILQAFPTLKLPPGEAVEPVGSERQTLALVVSPADGCRVKLRS